MSRATVREAIRRLRGEGLLEARRGSGTFVVHRHLDAPILGTSGLAQAITRRRPRRDEQGAAPGGRSGRRDGALALGIEPRASVKWVERLRYAGEEPLALDLSALALDKAQRRAFVGGDLDPGVALRHVVRALRAAGHRRQ